MDGVGSARLVGEAGEGFGLGYWAKFFGLIGIEGMQFIKKWNCFNV